MSYSLFGKYLYRFGVETYQSWYLHLSYNLSYDFFLLFFPFSGRTLGAESKVGLITIVYDLPFYLLWFRDFFLSHLLHVTLFHFAQHTFILHIISTSILSRQTWILKQSLCKKICSSIVMLLSFLFLRWLSVQYSALLLIIIKHMSSKLLCQILA